MNQQNNRLRTDRSHSNRWPILNLLAEFALDSALKFVKLQNLFCCVFTCAMYLVCLIGFFTSHRQYFSLTGTGLPGLNQY